MEADAILYLSWRSIMITNEILKLSIWNLGWR